jgi:hypothetical protein
MAGYAQVTLVGVDLDHVTTSRHDPQAAEYGGTVMLRARSQGIDFTYAYHSRTEPVSLMLLTGRQKACSANGLFEAVSPLARSKTGALTCRLSATDPRDPKVDAVDWVERIPFAETRNYVQRVMENLQVYRARFGASTATVGPNLHRAATIESRAEPTLVDSIPH